MSFEESGATNLYLQAFSENCIHSPVSAQSGSIRVRAEDTSIDSVQDVAYEAVFDCAHYQNVIVNESLCFGQLVIRMSL